MPWMSSSCPSKTISIVPCSPSKPLAAFVAFLLEMVCQSSPLHSWMIDNDIHRLVEAGAVPVVLEGLVVTRFRFSHFSAKRQHAAHPGVNATSSLFLSHLANHVKTYDVLPFLWLLFWLVENPGNDVTARNICQDYLKLHSPNPLSWKPYARTAHWLTEIFGFTPQCVSSVSWFLFQLNM